jgi:hypothetical protein
MVETLSGSLTSSSRGSNRTFPPTLRGVHTHLSRPAGASSEAGRGLGNGLGAIEAQK